MSTCVSCELRPTHLAEDGHESGGEGRGRVGPLYVLVNIDRGALQERVGMEVGLDANNCRIHTNMDWTRGTTSSVGMEVLIVRVRSV